MSATPEKYAKFCASLAENCNVGKAADAAGVNRSTAYRWREDDPDFAEAWDRAMKVGVTALEDEARRRAFEGIDKAVHYQGARVDVIREYSDTLAMFLLKAHDPEKYRERSDVNLKANVLVTDLTEDEMLAELVALSQSGVIPQTLIPQSDDDGSDLV